MGKIKEIIAEFDELKVFHVLRNSHILVDAQANIVVSLLRDVRKQDRRVITVIQLNH